MSHSERRVGRSFRSREVRSEAHDVTYIILQAKFGEGDERWLVKDLGQDGRNVNNWHWWVGRPY